MIDALVYLQLHVWAVNIAQIWLTHEALSSEPHSLYATFLQAVECGHEDCARLLLDARSDTNSYDRHGDSALHYAAQNGSIPMATMLLAIESTDIDAKNNVNIKLYAGMSLHASMSLPPSFGQLG